MKAVILSINREVAIVDLSNEIPRHDVASASYLLANLYQLYPANTIHLIVVDPDVGTSRLPIAVASPLCNFICPDNGVLSHILKHQDASVNPNPIDAIHPLTLPSDWQARKLTNRNYFRPNVSSTFHGRDIFASVAGHLSLGVPLSAFGEPLESILAFSVPEPTRRGATIVGRIEHVDHFGNLISNISADLLDGDDESRFVVHIGSETIYGLSKTYGDSEGLMCLVNSEGLLEIAVNRGNASSHLGVHTRVSIEVSAKTDHETLDNFVAPEI